MFRQLFFHSITAFASLMLANKFIPGVDFQGGIGIFCLCGFTLALLNAFIQPIIKKLTLPLNILTFGFFNLIILQILLVWLIDIIFPELIINGIIPLALTGLIIVVITKIILSKT